MLPDNIEDAHKMIEDLRRENADRRVKSKAYEESFSEFNESERAYLLELVRLTATDPSKGAIGFRDLAFQMLQTPEAFLDGLDIELPSANPEETTEPAEEASNESDDDMTGLTAEQLQAVLDEREAKAKEAADKAQQEQEIQAIFTEIEELGFEQGSEGFMGMLSFAQSQASAGKDVDFKALAPKVRAALDIPEPNSDAGSDAEKAAEIAVGEDKDPEPQFPSTVDAGGAGGAPTEKATDFVAEAKEKGIDPWAAARARSEARLSGAD